MPRHIFLLRAQTNTSEWEGAHQTIAGHTCGQGWERSRGTRHKSENLDKQNCRRCSQGEQDHSVFAAASDINNTSHEGWREAERNCVRQTVTRIHHNACRPSRSAQRQDSLGRHARGRHVERLKRGQSHVLSVCLGFQWRSVSKTESPSGVTLSSS